MDSHTVAFNPHPGEPRLHCRRLHRRHHQGLGQKADGEYLDVQPHLTDQAGQDHHVREVSGLSNQLLLMARR
jgi:hypothetical protein